MISLKICLSSLIRFIIYKFKYLKKVSHANSLDTYKSNIKNIILY